MIIETVVLAVIEMDLVKCLKIINICTHKHMILIKYDDNIDDVSCHLGPFLRNLIHTYNNLSQCMKLEGFLMMNHQLTTNQTSRAEFRD